MHNDDNVEFNKSSASYAFLVASDAFAYAEAASVAVLTAFYASSDVTGDAIVFVLSALLLPFACALALA